MNNASLTTTWSIGSKTHNMAPMESFSAYTKAYWAEILIVFAVYVITAKFGQFLLIAYDISPAVIWAPAGIGLAAVFLYGPRMLVPIALAHLFAAYTNPLGTPLLVALTGAIMYPLQMYIGARLLSWSRYTTDFSRTRDAIMLILVAFATPIIAPVVISLVRLLTDSLPVSVWVNISRAWAGGMLSILILTPLIVTAKNVIDDGLPRSYYSRECILVLLAIAGVSYLLFWTTLPQLNLFILLYVYFIPFFWSALRSGPHIMSVGLFLTTVLAIAGAILVNPSNAPLNTQLFASELFILLIAPIFLIITALVEEKRRININLHQYTENLEDALQQLALDDKSKNEFIAVLAHELRNPLASIVSALEVLKLKPAGSTDPKEFKTIVTTTHEQSQLMRRLLDDLLDLTRVTQKQFKLQKELVELQPLIKHCVASVEHIMKDQSHNLTVNVPHNPIVFKVDPVRFNQIVINLLSNAAKYTEPGGNINLTCYMEHEDLVLEVSDNGIGILEEDLEHIFSPFRQLHGTPRIGTGLGIGLSLTKQLVGMHGGTISAISRGLGAGTTFTVRIPNYTPAPESEANKKQAAIEGADSRPADRHSYSILVIDDNETAAVGIAKLLEYRGHKVRIAHTGIEGLSLATSTDPDIILLDIGLPDMDGYEVKKRLLREGVRAKTIAITGFGLDKDIERSRQVGFEYHLTKPAGLADIERAINAVV